MQTIKKPRERFLDAVSDHLLIVVYYTHAIIKHAYESLCERLCGKKRRYRNWKRMQPYLEKYPPETKEIVMNDERAKIDAILKAQKESELYYYPKK